MTAKFEITKLSPIASDTANNEGLPLWPAGWYIVARSKDLKPKRVIGRNLANRECVIFRSSHGSISALDAHCPHMGANLVHGTLVADELRCALHHWSFDVTGKGTAPKTNCKRLKSWPVTEQFGLVFLYLGDNNPGPVPEPQAPGNYVWTTVSPIVLKADWHCMAVNGFDMPHLNAVHHRTLRKPAHFAHNIEGNIFELNYESRVTGSLPSDLVMKWLSKDRIRVRQTCHGTTIVVETNLGFTYSSAVLGMLPTPYGVKAFAAFGIKPGMFSKFRLALTRWLFTAFLRRDFKVLEGMNLSTDVDDQGVQSFANFLRSLPRGDV